MNSLRPPIFPDNTEVNGTMKMKCLNIDGDNINEIVTGPKIVYSEGERSFLKSISIDGYRVTVSYIDDLFQGVDTECYLTRNGLEVIYIMLYSNGDINIRGDAYNSVDKSWKTISFNIDTDIQGGYIRRRNDIVSVSFDFILSPSSEHALYSSFISDMKYMSANVEVVKIIDGEGKNYSELFVVATANKPCLIISKPKTQNNVIMVLNTSTTSDPVFYVMPALGQQSRDGNPSGYPETRSGKSLPDETSQETVGFDEPKVQRLVDRLVDRIDELENKLRKFGIE